jgi:Uma2 family endonuclease
MGLPAKKPVLSREEFIAWENAQPDKSEFLDGEVFAMVGVRDRHNEIALNLAQFIRPHLKGSPCRTYLSDIKLEVAAADAVFYPDLFVTCAENADPLIKRDASLIVEILSPSTEAYDRGRKFASYRMLPSLHEYLLVSADEALVEIYTRTGDAWLLREYRPGDRFTLDSIDLALTVDDVFEDVDFSEPADENA